MRIGVFGGSFDPVHYGHLILAEQCREQANLDKILFVPAAVSPLKHASPSASDKQRVEMLSLAIAGHRSFEVATHEMERGGKSYTVETLTALRSEFTPAEFYLLMGQDSLATFSKWREPEKICEMAIPLVVGRPSSEALGDRSVDLQPLEDLMTNERFAVALDQRVTSRLIEISSTDIRHRVDSEKSIRFLTSRAVEKFIESNKLYQTK